MRIALGIAFGFLLLTGPAFAQSSPRQDCGSCNMTAEDIESSTAIVIAQSAPKQDCGNCGYKPEPVEAEAHVADCGSCSSRQKEEPKPSPSNEASGKKLIRLASCDPCNSK